MKKNMKKVLSIVLSLVMVLSVQSFSPANLQTTVKADDVVTSFNYEFAYSTPGYADGTIYINATEDGVYKVFWGDAEGNKLLKNGHEYSYLARVVVQDGKGSFNIENDYTAIPEGAETVLVYKKNDIVYTYNIPDSKKFVAANEGYTFGSLSDPHFTRYSSVYDDDAVSAMDNAMNFLDDAGVKFVAMSGDLTQAGEQLALDRFNAALAKHPDMTVVTAIGNHDSRTTLSTSDKSKLDTSITRWYNSITSTYFTVDADGTINSKLGADYPILASDALTNPIDTQYREEAGGEALDTTVPGLDFVMEAGGNIFIFFNDIAKTGEVYDTDKLITTGQMDWLEEQLEKYKDRNVFLYQHYFLCVNTLNNDSVDYNNCTGDLKNKGNYSYDLDYKDVVTTTSGKNLKALLTEYSNTTMVSGHSHWQYQMQNLNNNINFGRLADGNGGTLVHVSSVTEPRYIADDDANRTSLNGYASEGTTVTTYSDCTVYNSIDFANEQYEAYATYIVPNGDDSKYQPVKNISYSESEDQITGDQYLDADDMTTLQLLKSDFNLTYGAGYLYSSKGGENTDTALTDGKSTGSYFCSKEGKNNDQYVIIKLDGEQKVSNIKNLMIYFVNALTNASTFNVQISDDGENYQTIGNYSGMTYKDTLLEVNLEDVTLDTFKYVKINLTDGSKAYGYQIREFAVIGYERNQTPNTAESASSLEEGTLDEEDLLPSDYNLLYTVDYTQSSTGSENKSGALTNGSLSGGFMNTERSGSAKYQEIVFDLGKAGKQSVSNIDFFLLYSQNALTNVTAFNVSVSLDGENYETVGNYTNVDLDTTHFDPTVDLSSISIDKFRYVKLELTAGNTNYGYQIKEFALIGINPIEYPEVSDQLSLITDSSKNLALNKKVYVSTTATNEGKDPTVLTDGKTDKYWSSLWDNTLTSDYIVIDLGEEYDASSIGSAVIKFKEKATYCEDYRIEFSDTFDEENPDEGFYEVAKTKAASYDALLKYADSNEFVKTSILEAETGNIRYVKFKLNGHKDYGFQVREVAVIKKDKNISDSSISLEGSSFEYTGKEINPSVTATYDSVLLTKDKDYKVEYSDNTAVGTAKVVITGLGDYAGSVTETFEITPKTVNSDDISINVTFDDNNQPIVSASYGDIPLEEGTDYESFISEEEDGTIAVKLTAKGDNFTGTFSKVLQATDFPVNEAKDLSVTSDEVNKIKVSFSNPETYGASSQTYDIYLDDVIAEKGVTAGEYEFDEITVGEHTAKVIAHLGDKTSEGVSDTVNVSGIDISNAIINNDDGALIYSGSDIKPIESIVLNDNVLDEYKDYTIEYAGNVNAGTATYKVSGIGLYQGTIEGSFTILPADINSTVIDDSNLQETYEFIGKDITPIVSFTYNGTKLNSAIDYSVDYVDNFYTGEATVTYTGIGNYTGSVIRKFTIVKKPVENLTVKADFVGNNLVVTANNGSWPMTEGVDYTYTSSTDAEGNVTVTVSGIGDYYSGTVVKTIAAKNNPNRPTAAPATVVDTTKSVTPSVKTYKVKLSKAVNKKGKKVKLIWKKIKDATGYQVRYAKSKKKLKKAVIRTIKKNKATYMIKKLKKKTYFFQVREYKVVDKVTYFGKWSKVKKRKVTK